MGQRLRTVNRALVSYLGAPQQYRSGAQPAASEAGVSALFSFTGNGSMLHLPSRAATAASLGAAGLTLNQGSVTAGLGLAATLPQLSMHGSHSGLRAGGGPGLGTVVTELDGWPGQQQQQQQQQQLAGGPGHQVHAGHQGGAGAPEALLGGDLKLHVLQAHDLAVREGPHVEVYARWVAGWGRVVCHVLMWGGGGGGLFHCWRYPLWLHAARCCTPGTSTTSTCQNTTHYATPHHATTHTPHNHIPHHHPNHP